MKQTYQLPASMINQTSHVKPEQRMPFTIRVANDERMLLKAVGIRQSAYGRHVPELASKLTVPELADHDAGVIVLLAESKLDGSALGTMRIQINRYRPLSVEQSINLPDWLLGHSLSEATRLGVSGGRIGSMVKMMLFKSFFEYCLAQNVDWMVIAGRSPLDRQYEALLFQDVYPNQGFIPMQHAGNLPHRVMALRVASVEKQWKEVAHPLYSFFFETYHPDVILDVDQAYKPPIPQSDELGECNITNKKRGKIQT